VICEDLRDPRETRSPADTADERRKIQHVICEDLRDPREKGRPLIPQMNAEKYNM